jgi:hypothetical protein
MEFFHININGFAKTAMEVFMNPAGFAKTGIPVFYVCYTVLRINVKDLPPLLS